MRVFSICVCAALAATFVCGLPLSDNMGLQIRLRFDEAVGANRFADDSEHSRAGTCGMSAHGCPTSGQPGKYKLSASFGHQCKGVAYGANTLGNGDPQNRAQRIVDTASCGSKVNMNNVAIKDGTIMLWFQESGDTYTENLPQLDGPQSAHSDPTSKPTVVWRRPVDNGWDLSLVGGSGFALGRISSKFWGGYFCGKWHLAGADGNAIGGESPKTFSANPHLGWDHLAWHHYAAVFTGSTVMIYIDGVRVAVFRNVDQCQKQISTLGERSVRYMQQNGVRETEMTGNQNDRPRDNTPGALNYNLLHKDWSMNYYHGKMDEFRVYNKILTEAQILSAMNNVSQTYCCPLYLCLYFPNASCFRPSDVPLLVLLLFSARIGNEIFVLSCVKGQPAFYSMRAHHGEGCGEHTGEAGDVTLVEMRGTVKRVAIRMRESAFQPTVPTTSAQRRMPRT